MYCYPHNTPISASVHIDKLPSCQKVMSSSKVRMYYPNNHFYKSCMFVCVSGQGFYDIQVQGHQITFQCNTLAVGSQD